MDFYNGQVCSYIGDPNLHTFDPNIGIKPAYRICQCGEYKKIPCKCTDCGDFHQKIVPTDGNDQLQHRLLKLEHRITALEGRPRADVKETTNELTQ